MGNNTNRPGPGCGGAMPTGKWLDIASAPKDGKTWVLLWWPYWNRRHPVVGRRFPFGDWECAESVLDTSGDGPTHWRPLPDPPKGGEGDANT